MEQNTLIQQWLTGWPLILYQDRQEMDLKYNEKINVYVIVAT